MMIGVILVICCNEKYAVHLKHVDDNQNLHCRISATYVEAVKLSNCKCVLVVLSAPPFFVQFADLVNNRHSRFLNRCNRGSLLMGKKASPNVFL